MTKTPRKGSALLILVILGLIAGAWSGLLERFSDQYIDDSLLQAGVIYGTARGINAIVSALQGTEINAFLLTLSIGEVLDPVNDLIERFSTVILFALGSLAMQKILLEVVSHEVFNIILTALATMVVVAYRFGYHTPQWTMVNRLLLMTLFLRFSLALVVMLNSWVDTAFLRDKENQNHAAMEDFQGELREISGQTGLDTAADQQLVTTEGKIDQLRRNRSQHQAELANLGTRIAEVDDALRALGWPGWSLPWTEDSPEIAMKKNELTRLNHQREDLEAKISQIDKEIAGLREEIDCLQKRAVGEPCNVIERLTGRTSASEVAARLNNIDDHVALFSSNAINLLMSILLKSVLIPLVFLYLVLKLVQVCWRRL